MSTSKPLGLLRSHPGLAALLAAYFVILYILVGAAAGGADASGYFNEARLISQRQLHAPTRPLPGMAADATPPYLYVPLGFKPAPDGSGRLVPTYPAGLALMLVPASWVAGWLHAGDLVLLLHSLAGLALTYLLGRLLGLSKSWALAGAVLLAMSPLYLFMSLWAMSDVPALVWATAAVITALLSRQRPAWALASGVCAGVAFLVRPSNFLIGVPMLIILGTSPRRLLLAMAGGLPAIVAWMGINHAAYGAYLQSGYGAIGSEFHSSLVPGTIAFSLRWLPVVLSPLVAVAPGILGFLRTRTRVAAALAAWMIVYIAFYAPYRWTHEAWWFLRFLLPAAPALLVSGLIVLQWGFSRFRDGAAAKVVLALLFIASAWIEVRQIRPLHAWSIGHGELKYARVVAWLNAHVPRNTVIVAKQFSGALYYYTDYILIRSDQLDASTPLRVMAAARSQKRPVYAVVFPSDMDPLKGLPGKWVSVGTVDDITIWQSDL
jgi:hypothetical protein